MRYEVDQVSDMLKTYFSTNVPAVLVTNGLKPIEKFLSEPCDASQQRQLAVYPSDGDDTETMVNDGYVVVLQLPGEQNPQKWNSVIYPIVRKFDPKLVGYTSKQTSHSTWFPGESDDGGGGSFVIFEMKFSRINDSCDMEY